MNGHPAHAPARIAFRVLGPLEVAGPDGEPIDVCGGKPATMLTLLLLHRNAWVSTDQLIEAVWAGREAPASAQRNLKTYVWQLRRVLPGPPDRIESRPGSYRIHIAPGELDADIASELSARARRRLGEGSATGATEAVELVEEALGLWRGRAYDGLASPTADRLSELNKSLREDLADAQLALGRSADAISELQALTEEEPLRELAWTKLMTALHRTGRRHDALAAFQRARTLLVRDLGVEPGAELTGLHQEILAEGSERAGRASIRSNLPGRVPGFVGRSGELTAIVNSTRAPYDVPLVTIAGMPGIGKTALALEAAHELAGHYPDGRFYLDLRTHGEAPLGTAEALGKLIRAFRGPVVALPDADDELASMWRSTVRGQRVLLVLDDVASAQQVRQFLPGTAGSAVLVTSRVRLTGLNRTGSVSLDVLTDDEASELTAQTGSTMPAELHRWCSGHPAAIRSLTERLHDRPAWTAARMAARLADRPSRHRELAEVHALFDATYRALPERTRQLYRLLSLTPQFDLRRAARLLGAPQQEVEPVLDHLLDLHLVSEPAPGRFAIHPLVQDHAKALLLATDSEEELAVVVNRMRGDGRAELELVSPDGPRVA